MNDFIWIFVIVGLVGSVVAASGLIMMSLSDPILFILTIPLLIFCSWALYKAFKNYDKYYRQDSKRDRRRDTTDSE